MEKEEYRWLSIHAIDGTPIKVRQEEPGGDFFDEQGDICLLKYLDFSNAGSEIEEDLYWRNLRVEVFKEMLNKLADEKTFDLYWRDKADLFMSRVEQCFDLLYRRNENFFNEKYKNEEFVYGKKRKSKKSN